jgi:peptidoglycan hydrolase FlgJ
MTTAAASISPPFALPPGATWPNGTSTAPTPQATNGAVDAITAAKSAVRAKARATATDFEASFLSAMFGQMMTAIDGEGPFGGSGAGGVWRSFLGDEYGKAFAKSGGIGLADHVYRALLAQQEVPAR